MNIRDLIDEFYSFRPLPPPEETGLSGDLTLQDLPRAIQMLKVYEPYAEMPAYQGVADLRRKVGSLITGHLMATGWKGAQQIATILKDATWSPGPRNENDELVRLGRLLFPWIAFSSRQTDAGKFPTKREFRELVLWAFSYKQAGEDLDIVHQIVKGQDVFNRATVEQRAQPYFETLQKRFEKDPRAWLRLENKMGLGKFPANRTK